ncbi:MAG TPA: hypothetical protein VKL19_14150 [Thermoanaerobaculia bacterium]|nr:hypothetical protein [Thermoanaerobaculia bacterium]
MKLFRARVFTPVADPFRTDAVNSYLAFDDGFLAIDRSRIVAVGPWEEHPAGATVVDLGRDARSRRASSIRICTRRNWR